MLRGRLGEGSRKKVGCGFGEGCVDRVCMCMCGIKDERMRMGAIGSGRMGMVLGRRRRAGRTIGVERRGVERGLWCI